MFRISIIVFLFFIINVRDVEANKLHAAPALETINVNGKIEFSGFYMAFGYHPDQINRAMVGQLPFISTL